MSNVRTFSRSFAGGEVTPEFYGRIDDAKYQTGLAKCLNFYTLPHGPVANRPGFAFVREVKTSAKSTRLIPFAYSTTQTMVLEFGDGYIRFHTAGATLLAGSPAAYSGGTAYTVGKLVSSGGTNYYCIAATTGNAPPNATYWYPLPSAAYEIPSPYLEADLFDIHYVQSADVLTLVHPGYLPRELRRVGATEWVLSIIEFASRLTPPASPTATATPGSTPGTPTTQTYVVTAVGANGLDESTYSATASCSNNLFDDGAYNTINWTASTGASRYYVYKYTNGLYAYIGQTQATTFRDDNIAADVSITPPEINDPFLSSGNYPAAVSYFEQRRCFGGTTNAPQTLWMTRTGTESNLDYSIPTRDDDSIQFRVAAREANTIRHIVPLQQLVLLTSSAEWRVTSINSDAITPSSLSVKPQSYVGANNVQPVIVNNSLIFAAARGGHVRELGYNSQVESYVTGDLSIRAPHLFDNLNIVDMALAKAPQPIIWMVSSNGKLLGLTYVPEHAIGSWHQHDTDGSFESCCVVSEGNEDHLYVVVKRTIGGNTKRYVERLSSRQFEDPEDAFFVDSGASYDGTNTSVTTITITGGTTWGPSETLTATASSALFVFPGSSDVGDAIVLSDADGNSYVLTIESTSSSTVATVRVDRTLPVALRSVAKTTWAFARNSLSGLTHLEGKTVNILADGAVHPQRTVASGAVTLDAPATVVHVGLPITADLQTLPLAYEGEAFGQGRFKNVNQVWLRVYRSSGIFVGPSTDELVEAKQRTDELYGSPPDLKSEEIQVSLTPTWADSGQVYVRQSDPLPLTVVSMTLEVAIGS